MGKHPTIQPFSSFSVLIVFLLLCLLGLAFVPSLSIQLMPSRSYASIGIASSLPNASPQITELELTRPIESAVSGLKGVKRVWSQSRAGSTWISVDLDKWTDPDLFRFEVSTIMRQLYPGLPEGASYPRVYLNRPSQNNAYGQSIVGYTLNGPGTVNDIAELAEKEIRPALAALKGIYRTEISGARPRQLMVYTQPQKMAAAGLTYTNIRQQLSPAFRGHDLGAVATESGRQNLYIDKNVQSITDLQSTVVGQQGNRQFRLADMAEVKMGYSEPNGYYRINGQDMVSISIFPEKQVNTIDLANQVREAMQQASQQLPSDYELTLTYDQTEHLVTELNKVYVRTGLSVAILLLFVLLITRQFRYVLIVISALLVNVLLSVVFYYFLRLEIHLYSLAGITISLGLITDNVIVIVEDIRHTGRNRIFSAILASTLTAMGALSVIFLLDESTRINLVDFAITIMVTLLLSLPVAYFFIPALLEKLPIKVKKSPALFKRKKKLVKFSRFYLKQLSWMLRYKWCFVVLFVLCFGLPFYKLPTKVDGEGKWASLYNNTFGSQFYNQTLRQPINKYLGGALYLFNNNPSGSNYNNNGDEEKRVALYVRITMPNGATLAQMEKVTRGFERYLQNYKQQLDVFTARVSNPNYAFIEIKFKKAYESGFPHTLKRLLEEKAIMAGSADFGVWGVGRGFNNSINLHEFDSSISLKGYNYNQLKALALQVRDTLKQYARVQDIIISTSSRHDINPYQQFHIEFTHPKYLSLYRIGRWNMSSALARVQQRTDQVGYLNLLDKDVQVMIKSHPGDMPQLWATMNGPLAINDTTLLRLADVSQVKTVSEGDNIVRENQEYLLNVHYRFVGSYQLNGMVKEKVIKSMETVLPFGYSVEIPKYSRWFGQSDYTYLWLILLVFLIIYMICAILLESFVQPIAVVLMIPFSFIGVFLIFYFLGLHFNQGGYASLLMLSGLVTNVALYIINDINFIRKKTGINRTQRNIKLYIKAFNSKAMPIMITTASAVLSLLPFMLVGDEQGFWFTLSAGTIGGLLFSLLGAYIMLPLALLRKMKKKKILQTGKHG